MGRKVACRHGGQGERKRYQATETTIGKVAAPERHPGTREMPEQLNKWVDEWERAERLQPFIAAYAEKSRSWSAEKQPQYKAWIEWATQQADRLDAFVSEKPTSVLDRKHEVRGW